jgi:hypothetical protein
VLQIGNFSRAFEHWIARAQGSTSPEIKGSKFEVELCSTLLKAAKQTNLPVPVEVSKPSCWIGGEEIDCLCRVGDIVLVIEAKCFITPGDPLERFNFLRKLASAATQARRKAEAIKTRPKALENIFSEVPKDPAIHPLVIVPSSYGVGTEFEDVPILDQNYLRILLGSTTLSVGAAHTGEQTLVKTISLYESVFNEAEFIANLKSPHQIRRLLQSMHYSHEPFPSGIPGTEFYLHMARVKVDMDEAIVEMAKSLQSKAALVQSV